MWQEIVIIIIAVLVVVSIGYRLYCYFSKSTSPCDDCSGCVLKEELNEKQSVCKDLKKKSNIN